MNTLRVTVEIPVAENRRVSAAQIERAETAFTETVKWLHEQGDTFNLAGVSITIEHLRVKGTTTHTPWRTRVARRRT